MSTFDNPKVKHGDRIEVTKYGHTHLGTVVRAKSSYGSTISFIVLDEPCSSCCLCSYGWGDKGRPGEYAYTAAKKLGLKPNEGATNIQPLDGFKWRLSDLKPKKPAKPKKPKAAQPTAEPTVAITDLKDAKLGDVVSVFLDADGKVSRTRTDKTISATVWAAPTSNSNSWLPELGWRKGEPTPLFVLDGFNPSRDDSMWNFVPTNNKGDDRVTFVKRSNYLRNAPFECINHGATAPTQPITDEIDTLRTVVKSLVGDTSYIEKLHKENETLKTKLTDAQKDLAASNGANALEIAEVKLQAEKDKQEAKQQIEQAKRQSNKSMEPISNFKVGDKIEFYSSADGMYQTAPGSHTSTATIVAKHTHNDVTIGWLYGEPSWDSYHRKSANSIERHPQYNEFVKQHTVGGGFSCRLVEPAKQATDTTDNKVKELEEECTALKARAKKAEAELAAADVELAELRPKVAPIAPPQATLRLGDKVRFQKWGSRYYASDEIDVATIIAVAQSGSALAGWKAGQNRPVNSVNGPTNCASGVKCQRSDDFGDYKSAGWVIHNDEFILEPKIPQADIVKGIENKEQEITIGTRIKLTKLSGQSVDVEATVIGEHTMENGFTGRWLLGWRTTEPHWMGSQLNLVNHIKQAASNIEEYYTARYLFPDQDEWIVVSQPSAPVTTKIVPGGSITPVASPEIKRLQDKIEALELRLKKVEEKSTPAITVEPKVEPKVEPTVDKRPRLGTRVRVTKWYSSKCNFEATVIGHSGITTNRVLFGWNGTNVPIYNNKPEHVSPPDGSLDGWNTDYAVAGWATIDALSGLSDIEMQVIHPKIGDRVHITNWYGEPCDSTATVIGIEGDTENPIFGWTANDVRPVGGGSVNIGDMHSFPSWHPKTLADLSPYTHYGYPNTRHGDAVWTIAEPKKDAEAKVEAPKTETPYDTLKLGDKLHFTKTQSWWTKSDVIGTVIAFSNAGVDGRWPLIGWKADEVAGVHSKAMTSSMNDVGEKVANFDEYVIANYIQRDTYEWTLTDEEPAKIEPTPIVDVPATIEPTADEPSEKASSGSPWGIVAAAAAGAMISAIDKATRQTEIVRVTAPPEELDAAVPETTTEAERMNA